MNTRSLFFVCVAIGIAIFGIFLAFSLMSDAPPENTFNPLVLDFDYSINSIIDLQLSEKDISMSSPIKISKQAEIAKYCTFFDDIDKQNQIQYCTSTELLDNNGTFLGNIHLIGTPEVPKLVIVILDVPSENIVGVVSIFETVINTTVCQCWEQVSPDGFSSISAWVTGLDEFHKNAPSEITTKSSVIALDDKKIQIELTTDENSKLWKLFVAK